MSGHIGTDLERALRELIERIVEEKLEALGLGKPAPPPAPMPDGPRTISVPEAGKRYFGLSANASYEAAKRGDIPTIKIGRLRRVSVYEMEQIMAKRR